MLHAGCPYVCERWLLLLIKDKAKGTGGTPSGKAEGVEKFAD